MPSGTKKQQQDQGVSCFSLEGSLHESSSSFNRFLLWMRWLPPVSCLLCNCVRHLLNTAETITPSTQVCSSSSWFCSPQTLYSPTAPSLSFQSPKLIRALTSYLLQASTCSSGTTHTYTNYVWRSTNYIYKTCTPHRLLYPTPVPTQITTQTLHLSHTQTQPSAFRTLETFALVCRRKDVTYHPLPGVQTEWARRRTQTHLLVHTDAHFLCLFFVFFNKCVRARES